MKILLTGAAGQLGQALRQQVPGGVELIATSRSGDPATGLLPLDLADAAACRAAVLEHRPDWVEPLGFQVTEAENGQVALDCLQQKAFDLVITDLVMPVLDGFAFLKILRQQASFKTLKVLVSSASVSNIDRRHSIEAGGDDFLAKPIQVEELWDLLGYHLDLHWRYQPLEMAPSPTSTPSSTLVLPPTEVLQRLLDLAQDGLLPKITEQTKTLAQEDARYLPFSQNLLQLAQQFDTDALEDFLLTHLSASSPV
ncbi:MAG: response regulator [Microcystaceae cyanobacterium]